jgi:hypothetical protein
MGTAARRCAPPDDTAGLRAALRDTMATLREIRSGPRPDPVAVAALEVLADSIEGAGFRIAVAAGEEVGRDAETFTAGFLAGRSVRPRIPRQRPDRHGLRSVPGGRSRLTAVPAVAALVALVFAPHHVIRAAEGARPVAVSASRPSVPVLDLSKAQRRDERITPGRDRL